MKKHSTLFIGLDTHKDSIAVAYATDSRTEPVTYLGAIGTQYYTIRNLPPNTRGKALLLITLS